MSQREKHLIAEQEARRKKEARMAVRKFRDNQTKQFDFIRDARKLKNGR